MLWERQACGRPAGRASFPTGPEEAFPALVAQALGVAFANAGVAGDTMGAGLARMERDVLPHGPRLVVPTTRSSAFRLLGVEPVG